VHVPHSDQQVGKIYYLSCHKVHLFGVQNEATKEQLNYVLDENEIQRQPRYNEGLRAATFLQYNGVFGITGYLY